MRSYFLQNKKHIYPWITFFIIPFSGCCIDIYTPSLPAMAHYFGSTHTMIQLTITFYLFAFMAGQLLVGPYTDSIGRKKPMLVGAGTQILLLIGIVNCHNIFLLWLLRALQGLSVALISVPARAILSDLFTGPAFKKQANMMTISWAMGPILAPWIGGHLQHAFGWQANFVFLIGYVCVITLILLLVYRETLPNHTPFKLSKAYKNYLPIISEFFFMTGVSLLGVLLSLMMAYNLMAPFLVQTLLHHNAIVFGRSALLMGLSWFMGNTINRLICTFISEKVRCMMALSGIMIVSLSLFALTLTSTIHLLGLLLPSALLVGFAGFLFPIFVGECLSKFPRRAGSANAILFSTAWGIAACVTLIISKMGIHSVFPLALTFVILAILGIIIYGIMQHASDQ